MELPFSYKSAPLGHTNAQVTGSGFRASAFVDGHDSDHSKTTALLRCGTLGLSTAEAVLVRTLFKLYQHGASEFGWTLVDAAPYDAILVDSSFGDNLDATHEHVKARLTLGPNALAALPNTLTRPLRSELLKAWLVKTQNELRLNAMVPAPQINYAEIPTPTPTPAPIEMMDEACEADTFKLVRWPPAAMLRNDPKLIRMATVLSRREMRISEVAQVSQQPFDKAHAFVTLLRNAGLLNGHTLARAAVSPIQIGASRTVSTPPNTSLKVERSLMSRIRQRLGL